MSRWYWRFSALGAGVQALSACANDPEPRSCYTEHEPGAIYGTGSVEIAYTSKSLGTASIKDAEVLVTATSSEDVVFHGCDDSGRDIWLFQVGIHVPVTAEQPVAFGATETGPSVWGQLGGCEKADCTFSEDVLGFGVHPYLETVYEGDLRHFDPQAGDLDAEVTLREPAGDGNETTIGITANISWPSSYQPVVQGSLSGLWLLESSDGADGAPLPMGLELVQEGPRLRGRVCDADFQCQDSDLYGDVPDPYIRLEWTMDEAESHEIYSISAELADGGSRFDGFLTEAQSNVWAITGRRVDD